jgi:signal transduction histidine kinase
MSIKIKLIITFLIIAIVPMVFIGFISFSNAKKALFDQQLERVESFADLKATKIEVFFERIQSDIKLIQDNFIVRTGLPTIIKYSRQRTDPVFLHTKKRLDGQLKIWSQGREEFNDLMLLDTEGTVVYATSEAYDWDDLGEKLSDPEQKAFKEGTKGIYATQIFDDGSKNNTPVILITAPLYDFDERLIGVVAFEVEIEKAVLSLLTVSGSLGQSGRVLLAEKQKENVVIMNPAKTGDKNDSIDVKLPLAGIKSSPIKLCLNGEEGSGLETSYDDIGVLAAWRLLPFSGWALVVEIERREAFVPITTLLSVLMTVGGALLLAVVLIAVLIARSMSNPIVKLTEQTKTIAAGDLSSKIEITSSDEIGQLAESFNNMTKELKLQRIIDKEKTEELGMSLKHSEVQKKALEENNTAMLNILDDLEVSRKLIEEEKVKLREQKKDLEKTNLELDSFVYTASHDLRAPLRGIASFATFLEEDYKDAMDEGGKDYLNEIRIGANRMKELIDNLLTLSRISRIKNPYEKVEIKTLIESVKERTGYDISEYNVELKVEPKVEHITCDKIKMEEVFVNLIGNAIKFSSKRETGHPVVEIGCEEKEDNYEFFIKDNGIGIDPRFHDQIFGIFKRLHTDREYEGTGAGLNIVKRIVNDHGGRVWVESELGKGSTFKFTIPKGLA